jgi:predicted PhzF superfamily epimerase YddE/YHI9
MTVSLTWVDAFTDRLFGGNPAAVCLLEQPLPEARMQSLAFELGISETAFVVPTGTADEYDLRWFTPAVEIDLCGHATLASAHALRHHGRSDGVATLTFHTRSGALRAAFVGERIELDFPADPVEAATLPGPLVGQWAAHHVLESARTGHYVVVVLDDPELVRDYQPDLGAIAAIDAKALVVTAIGAPGPEAESESESAADYVLRVFGPNVGIDEDPATGSAQCVLGPYWSAALGRPRLVAHQVSARGAVFSVRPDVERVHFGGHAVTVFRGAL